MKLRNKEEDNLTFWSGDVVASVFWSRPCFRHEQDKGKCTLRTQVIGGQGLKQELRLVWGEDVDVLGLSQCFLS